MPDDKCKWYQITKGMRANYIGCKNRELLDENNITSQFGVVQCGGIDKTCKGYVRKKERERTCECPIFKEVVNKSTNYGILGDKDYGYYIEFVYDVDYDGISEREDIDIGWCPFCGGVLTGGGVL